MRTLLDTHILLWMRSAPERLPQSMVDVLADTSIRKMISVVSLTEIAIKVSTGKLDVGPRFFDTVGNLGLEVEPFGVDHARALAELPWIHRDPFDRMLVAQAMVDGATLLTVDPNIRKYPVSTLS
ncbi:type II toxin-antitoxin system VapC family toxin [Gordonia sp. (in: high G+C Gram-positive bacteria)]|uniref:type II toxin-antitoxin system VapC family toxin n=1 Tax=Gordonia sp. (in: high G+C Gram-positive bacteria) TaxID=84139 RepID=UPI0025BF9100|nr:type II toxin-antitoxin system VapC family toxin [Gordonia sp. (in: high G+C Gram-positive bacteria)]HMS73872.1 type II toxin-antitoxin system VapC family toxin [Gordonia sp. (in: high G+C Gram-positive bacteria)]HQV21297.1 type II toxin-antitoxin system VapC family toxin [Gordonia sp. (in: high G+C Gram-positive bacteria)]